MIKARCEIVYHSKENPQDIVGSIGVRILKSMRKIIRAVDLHSKKLNQAYHVTVPQMVCIYALLNSKDRMTCSDLTREVDLSASTVNGIIDRLEKKGLAIRERDKVDRRKVYVHITPKGRALAQKVPSLLQDRLSSALAQLPDLEQTAIALTLERIVELMDVRELDAAPLLVSETSLSSDPQVENPPDLS